MLQGLWDRPRGGKPRTRRDETGRGNRCRPELSPLESRTLLFVSTLTATAVPDILAPPNGRVMPVVVSGAVSNVFEAKTPGYQPEVPRASFQVTDEYRRVEPHGPVMLQKTGDFSFQTKEGKTFVGANYEYSFTIFLQAERSSRDPDGRQYSVLVASDDSENGQGTTIPVLVPRNRADAITAQRNQAARQELQQRLRDLPRPPATIDSQSFFKKLGF